MAAHSSDGVIFRVPFYRYAGFICLVLIIAGVTWHAPPKALTSTRDSIHDIQNTTLGFAKVFAIGFPSRTDKRDALTLAASFTDFEIEWVDAVAGVDVSSKAAPSSWDFNAQTLNALGCWRAHMNVIEQIVKRRISTALIFEDDSDWDISLKRQLQEFAIGTRSLEGSSSATTSPYGSSWDFLWLGTCKIGTEDKLQPYYVIEDDPTVPPLHRRFCKWRQSHVLPEVLQNTTRLVFEANGGSCAYSYAVTFEGARKILSAMSLMPRNEPVDIGYKYMCGGRWNPSFKCFGVYPPLTSCHRAAGSGLRDSDLNHKSDAWHKEYRTDIVFSTIQNIQRLVNGVETVLAQWPGEVPQEQLRYRDKMDFKAQLRVIDVPALAKENILGINV